ncbi:hypothetical protein ABK040_010462 [Willaertia magna]
MDLASALHNQRYFNYYDKTGISPSLDFISITNTVINNVTNNGTDSNVTHSDITGFLFLTSFSATLEMVIECAIGFLLFYFKILNSDGVQLLSKLVFYVFTPALFLFAMAKAANLELLKTVWILIPMGIIITVIGNFLSQFAFFKGFWKNRMSKIQRNALIASTTFWNGQNFPLVFLAAIAQTAGNGALWNIPIVKAHDLFIAYINISTLLPTVIFWSYGLELFSPPDDNIDNDKQLKNSDSLENNKIELLDNESQESLKELEEGEQQLPHEIQQPKKSLIVKIRENKFYKKFIFLLKKTLIYNPPIISMILGIIIGFITPLKNFLIEHPPIVVSSISHILTLFSTALFPTSMIILGANVAMTVFSEKKDGTKGEEEIKNQQEEEKQSFLHKVKSKLTLKNVIDFFRNKAVRFNHPIGLAIAVTIKLIIMPVMAVGIIYLCKILGVMEKDDPMIILVMLIHFAAPMAMATTTLASLNNDNGQNE